MFGWLISAVVFTCGVGGCEFNCPVAGTASLCGGPVQYINTSVQFPIVNGGAELVIVSFGPLHTLDLTGRNITGIGPGGLDCFFAAFPPTSDLHTLKSNHTQAVFLDNNSLTEVPDMAVFGAVSVVYARENAIATVLPGLFRNFTGPNMCGILLHSRSCVDLMPKLRLTF